MRSQLSARHLFGLGTRVSGSHVRTVRTWELRGSHGCNNVQSVRFGMDDNNGERPHILKKRGGAANSERGLVFALFFLFFLEH